MPSITSNIAHTSYPPSSYVRKEEFQLAEAILVGGRMGAVEQTIYKWKQYQANGTNTYYWNRYNVVSTTTYKWNKWNAINTYRYAWMKYNTNDVSVRASSYDLITNGSQSGVWSSTISGLRLSNPPSNCKTYLSYGGYSSYGYNCSSEIPISSIYGNYNGSWQIPCGGNYYLAGWILTRTIYGVYTNTTYYDRGNTRVKFNSWSCFHFDACVNQGSDDCPYLAYRMYTNLNPTTDAVPIVESISGTGSKIYDDSSDKYPQSGMLSSDYNYYYVYQGQEIVSTSKGSTSYGQVTSTSSSAYPSNGANGSYWYVSAGSDVSYSKGSTSYPDISSTNRSAYPDNSYSGSYWYVYSTYTTEYSQGDYIGDRLSTDRDRWPDNGKDGDYWYVFDGEA